MRAKRRDPEFIARLKAASLDAVRVHPAGTLDAVRRLSAEGLRVSEIAARLRLTKNVVSGIRYRLGLTDASRSPIKRPAT